MARILAEAFEVSEPAVRQLKALSLVLVLVSSLSGCAWLSAKERALTLRPSPGRPAEFVDDAAGRRAGDQRWLVAMPASDGSAANEQLALWWLPHPDPTAPTLLYLHGTLRNLYENLPKIVAVRDAGYSIVAVDYRGWGDSSAIIPSELTINADAARAWAELVARQPDPLKRVVFGHSMGSAAAVTLASTLRRGIDFGGLVLEAPFTRMPDVAAAAGTLGRVGAALTSLKFESIARIGRVEAPIVILHGAGDKLVPVELGRRLRDAARPGSVCFVEFAQGSHSGLHKEDPARYRDALRAMSQVLPLSTPVQRWPAGLCPA